MTIRGGNKVLRFGLFLSIRTSCNRNEIRVQRLEYPRLYKSYCKCVYDSSQECCEGWNRTGCIFPGRIKCLHLTPPSDDRCCILENLSKYTIRSLYNGDRREFMVV